jgi:uncharacterized membrane protein
MRLVTVHPALAHLSVGALPILVLCYAVAAWRRSTEWSMAGDVVGGIAALGTIATFAFGLVSDAAPWPGGLERWRLVHLICGAVAMSLLLVIALMRIMQRRRERTIGWGTLVLTLVTGGVMATAGWIGGEVLVFRAGMAVTAAGDGATAPPVEPVGRTPRDFLDAMRHVRASWGDASARTARMIVQHPSDESMAAIAADGDEIARLARWMGDVGSRTLPNRTQQRLDSLVSMAQGLVGEAEGLRDAAKKKDLTEVTKALGQVGSTCADCHEALRGR